MNKSTRFFSCKNAQYFLATYLPEGHPRAIVQINHGLAEHSLRYDEFATFLCRKGYAVYVHDHPAHGQSVSHGQPKGHLPWKKGWDQMLDVIHNINKYIRKNHIQIPVFLMGHSMGSLLSRHYNATYPMYFKGVILSGTSNPSPSSLKSVLTLTRAMALFHKPTHYSKWLNQTFYKNFNKNISRPKTKFDWLSSDPDQVEKYIHDSACGFPLSLGFYKSLLQGTLQMLKTEKNLRFRKNLATLIISGKQDAVGNFGKGPQQVQLNYAKQGYFNTHLRLIDGRHELLNETEAIKQQAFHIIEEWMSEKLSGGF